MSKPEKSCVDEARIPEIRRAQESDRDAIVDLFVRVNRELATPDLAEEFDDYVALSLDQEIIPFLEYYNPTVGNGFWVAIIGGGMVGMYGLERASVDEVELRRMYVAPEHRRKGLARVMLHHAERMAAAEGYTRMILATAEMQRAAIALYRAEGFRLVRREHALARTNKTIGGGIARFHFEKDVPAANTG